MRDARMLAQKEVWPLSPADNDLGWELAKPERLTVGFRVAFVSHTIS